ncbi:amidohydrolase family protein [Lacisediminihabitans sp. G11-30]|uniref:Amidohydrolase family protein n=1 Tax=Lacisediminihabitans changchengi TaxID=2787634 RepID=A0A934SJA9_9MICO|nr:amidohydrolase family protein [Lacisediminihabitans changchengi]
MVPNLPRRISVIRNATLANGDVVDVRIDGSTVVEVAPARSSIGAGDRDRDADRDSDALDLRGFLLLTAPAEPHAHLDKAMSWDLINPPMGDLVRAIDSWRAYSSVMTEDSIADRARSAALRLLANGTTAIRSHVDLLVGDEPLRGVRALVRVRDELRDLMDIELVALAASDLPDSTIEEAIDLGIDLVGGAPHLAPEPLADLRRLLAVAERRGVGVDMHTDESLTGAPTLGELARIVRDWETPVSAGHCVRLGTLEPAELADVITEVLASDIGIISLPITNLYLQGWQQPVSTPRGLTALRALLDAGVRVAAGADNVRDPFNPVGRSDALETASLLVTAGHLTLDEAYAAVSAGARDVMNLPVAGVQIGAAAELVAVRGTNLSDVVANASADRYVIHAGSLVAQSTVSYEIAAIRSNSPLVTEAR